MPTPMPMQDAPYSAPLPSVPLSEEDPFSLARPYDLSGLMGSNGRRAGYLSDLDVRHPPVVSVGMPPRTLDASLLK